MKFIHLYTLIILYCIQVGHTVQAQTWNSVKAEKLYQQGLDNIKHNQANQAILSLEEAIKLNPKHIDAQVQLAKLYMGAKRYDQSIRTATAVIKASPQYEDVYYYIIGSYLSINQPAKAIQYTELALVRFPGNKDFGIKKLNILDVLKRFQEGDKWAQVLFNKFPLDRSVKLAIAGHYETRADWYVQNNMPAQASTYYEKVLDLFPNNQDIKDKINNIVSQGGDYDAKIASANALLNKDNKSYTALHYKLGLLQETNRYAEALEVLRTILRYYPNDAKSLSLNNSMRKEAASFYQNTDPYALYQSILDQNPTDSEALDKVIGIATSRGELNQALYWTDRALKRTPSNPGLLRKKMDFVYELGRYRTAADLAKQLYPAEKDPASKSEMLQIINRCGNYYLQEMLADSAIIYFDQVLLLDKKNLSAIQGRINGLMMQNNLSLVLRELDKALAIYPKEEELLLKKAGFLEQAGKIHEASYLSSQLFKNAPDNPKIRSLYLEQKLAVANSFIQAEEYREAEEHLHDLLDEEPENKDALHHLSNILDLRKNYPEARAIVERALVIYPQDRDFLQKKASILYNEGHYVAAANLAQALRKEYPYNNKYKLLIQDAWLAAGIYYQKNQALDSALICFDHLIQENPADSVAYLHKTGILMRTSQFESALIHTDLALQQFEYAEPFLLQKVIILDSLQQYIRAASYADTLYKIHPSEKHKDYAAWLLSKTYKNQFALSLLNSSFSAVDEGPAPPTYRLAMLSYNRVVSAKLSYSGQLTFTGRQQGTGIMGEGTMSYTMDNGLYWDASLGLSNNVLLPKYRISYSLFKPLKNGYTGEIGLRFLEVVQIRALSAVTSLSKSFGPFTVNARLFGIMEEDDFYIALNGSTQYNLSDRDLLQVNVGLGTSPDDRSRLILLPELGGILSRTVGAGYRRTFNYRTTLGIFGSLTNQKVSESTFRNQYDVQLSLGVRF